MLTISEQAGLKQKTGLFSLTIPQQVFAFIAVLTIFRLWFCTQVDLVGDEAYYWLWSKHLDLSYYSKGPAIAWTIGFGTSLMGDNVFGVRWPAVGFATATAVLFYQLGKSLFSMRVGMWAVICASLVPLFMVGSFVMTIDALSVFCWILAAWLFWKNRHHETSTRWITTGLAVGIGMLAKYTNVAELISFGLFCALTPEHRRDLKSRKFWYMVGAALVCLLPVIVWNNRHDWITISHLIHRGSLDQSWKFSPLEVLAFIGGQFLIFNPLFMMGLVFGLWMKRKILLKSPPYIFLSTLFWPLIVFYFVLSFNKTAQLNWTAPSFVAGVLLLSAIWTEWSESRKWIRLTGLSVLGISAMFFVLTHLIAFVPLSDVFTSIKQDPLRRLRGQQDMANQVHQAQMKYGANFLIANKYTLASLISFYHPDQPQTYIPNHEGVMNQFSFWPSYSDGYWRDSAIFVSDTPDVPSQLYREFTSIEPVEKISYAMYKGKPVRPFYMFVCKFFGGEEESTHFDTKLKQPIPQ
jgi:4-amino-4-deoxy-L-arabinose transferase-like glycosyltransferase